MKSHMKALSQAWMGAALLLPSIISAGPSAAAPPAADQVVIINSGDRLTPGYQVTVGPHGSLTGVLVPRGQHTPIRRTDRMIAVNQQRFFADLAQAAPLSALPTGSAPRRGRRGRRQGGRTSPGAVTAGVNPLPQVFVRYKGQQSPNLRIAGSQSGRVLYQDVKQILQVLRLPIPDVP